MITEVQVTGVRSHVPYLQKTVRRLAASTGMNHRDAEDIAKAVGEVCTVCLKSMPDTDGRLGVVLFGSEVCVTAEVSDRSTVIMAAPSGETFEDISYFRGMEDVCRLVDRMEFIRDSDRVTIRLTKNSSMSESTEAREMSVARL